MAMPEDIREDFLKVIGREALFGSSYVGIISMHSCLTAIINPSESKKLSTYKK